MKLYLVRGFLIITVLWGVIMNPPPTGINLDLAFTEAFSTWSNPLGCDVLGRDILALYGYGVLSTVILAIPARILTLGFSIVIAILSYILGKIARLLLDQISYVFLSVPSLLIALLVVAGLGTSFITLPLAIVFSDWAFSYESIKSKIREIQESPYVSISYSMGASGMFVFRNHILPGIFSMLWYLFITGVPTVIMALALFSFLGVDWSSDILGPGLGEQIAFSADYFDRNSWAVYAPIIGIVMLVMGLGKK